MRLIHTSDWHLGQTLHSYERRYEHECFLGWLLDTLEEEQADALLIAGDVFDSANPTAAAQQQFYRFLTQARARVPHLSTVLIAGNHDSPARLEMPSPLLTLFDAVVVGQVRRQDGQVDVDSMLVPLRNRQGQVAAWCLAVPFLRPGDLPRPEGWEDEHEGNPYQAAVSALYQQALQAALARRQAGQAIIALGHCHMRGGEVSEDSERRIVIGGAEALPASLFGEEIAYAALGHLHRAQKVGGQERLRYAGSPLPLSFSETAYQHQVLRIDLKGEQLAAVQPLHIPRAVGLLRIPASAADLDTVLQALAALDLPELPEQQQPYLEVRVQLTEPEPGLRSRIEAALQDKPVRLAKIDARHTPGKQDAMASCLSLDELDSLQAELVFQELYRRKVGEEIPAALQQAFQELLHTVEGEA